MQVFPQVNILHKGLLMKSLIFRWFPFSFTKKTDSRFKVQTSYQRVLYLKIFFWCLEKAGIQRTGNRAGYNARFLQKWLFLSHVISFQSRDRYWLSDWEESSLDFMYSSFEDWSIGFFWFTFYVISSRNSISKMFFFYFFWGGGAPEMRL